MYHKMPSVWSMICDQCRVNVKIISYYLATQLDSFLAPHCCRKYQPVLGLSWAQEHSWPGASSGHIVTTPRPLHTSWQCGVYAAAEDIATGGGVRMDRVWRLGVAGQ